jgi:phosphatidyl-myo-inositol alpha-mannosyltransferase
MRIALTNPTAWPYVRRGAERLLDELARYLTTRGHAVTVISGKPGPSETTEANGYTMIRSRRLWHPAMARFGLLEFHVFFWNALARLVRHRFDVVYSMTFMDGFAAQCARSFTGAPSVLLVNGLPPRVRYYRSLSLGGAFFGGAVKGADVVQAISGYVQDYVRERWATPTLRLPVPVDLERWPLSRARDHERPVILCASALDDARKGGRLLMHAFDRLKRARPELRLQVAYPVGAAVQAELLSLVSPEWRDDVEFRGQADDLARLYGQAALTVLPSIWEAFGMVVLESMATGTPVVGTRDGALPELIDSDAVGRLFDPGPLTTPEATNVDGLVEAMGQGLELGRDPNTAVACRERAEEFRWEALGPRYEAMLEQATVARRAAVSVPGTP